MGFTLIELLVAIAVLSLMMTLAARIFFDAQTGVQRGLQTSQIIAESRSISQPLTKDIRSMNVFESKYGSNSPGWLVIHQAAFGGVKFPAADDINSDPSSWIDYIDLNGDGTQQTPAEPSIFMRSDQIAFFRDANGLESLTPGESDRYDSDVKARHARVWYGHVSPVVDTDDDLTTFENSLNPGDAGYNLASQMVLGRQALLLVENDASTNYPDGVAGDETTVPVNPKRRIPPANGSVEEATYGGLYDVLVLRDLTIDGATYGVYDDGGVAPATGEPRGLFRTPRTSSFTPPAVNRRSLFGAITYGTTDELPDGDYADKVVSNWLYVSNNRRLQARTSIDTDFQNGGGIFTADELAQLHAAFAPHVADFAIEFAADWTDDWDDSGGTRVAGEDGQPDNEPDRDDAGNIVWYTLLNPNPDGDGTGPDLPRGDGNYDGVGKNDPSAPVTYNANIAVAEFLGNPGNDIPGPFIAPLFLNPFVYPGNNIVFSHTGDDNDVLTPTAVDGCGKFWPYLIRFRYRLMDGKGEFRSIENNPDGDGDGTPNDPTDFPVVGRWFEQIVPVPRPQGLY